VNLAIAVNFAALLHHADKRRHDWYFKETKNPLAEFLISTLKELEVINATVNHL
jgi:hypothetical protein